MSSSELQGKLASSSPQSVNAEIRPVAPAVENSTFSLVTSAVLFDARHLDKNDPTK